MNKTDDDSRNRLILAGLILVIFIIIAIVIRSMTGSTVVTGEHEGQLITETLVCESDQTSYPFFEHDNTDSKNLKVNATFENDKLASISLVYKLDYASLEEAKNSESFNHADLNLSFYDDDMEADSLNAKYSFLGNSLQLTIFAQKEDITEKTLKYFMLYNVYSPEKLTQEKLAKTYNEKGLSCTIKSNNTKEEVNENH